MIIELARNKKM